MKIYKVNRSLKTYTLHPVVNFGGQMLAQIKLFPEDFWLSNQNVIYWWIL
jgi:hypothetical protein